MFHYEKKNIYTVSNFREKLVEAKALEPCAVGFWKRKLNFNVGKKHVIVELEMFPGNKTPSTTTENTAQYHNIYRTNILLSKMNVREKHKCLYCIDTVDSIEHFFAECPVVPKLWKFIAIILREFGI